MPAVTRIGDPDVINCSVPFRLGCSTDVFVNSLGISRQGDNNTPHANAGAFCAPHQTSILVGSTTVFVNSKGCGRVGDLTGCTAVAGGSDNVFAGG